MTQLAKNETSPVMTVVQNAPETPTWVDYLKENGPNSIIDLDIIICEFFHIDPDLLFTRTRSWEIKDARFAYWYVMNRWFGYGYNSLARITPWTHSNILQAMKKVENWIETEPAFKNRMDRVKNKIQVSLVRVPADPIIPNKKYNLVYRGETFIQTSDLEKCSKMVHDYSTK